MTVDTSQAHLVCANQLNLVGDLGPCLEPVEVARPRCTSRALGWDTERMPATPLLQKVDAVQILVPDLDAGLRFYRDRLGHELRWRNDQIGQAGLDLPGSDTEIA
jgi:hypothetical protein